MAGDHGQKRFAAPAKRTAKPLRDCRAEIRKGLAPPDSPRLDRSSEREEGYALPGVVGGACRRIVSVVGPDEQQIVLAKGINERGQRLVELLQRPVEPRNVIPVPEHLIE